MNYTTLTTTIDPTGWFREKKVPSNKLLDVMGLIPEFVFQTAREAPEDASEAMDLMVRIYGFGDYRFTGGFTVSPEGVYSYPEDPDLYPACSFKLGDSDIEILVYQYAMVCIRDKDTTIMTRMD